MLSEELPCLAARKPRDANLSAPRQLTRQASKHLKFCREEQGNDRALVCINKGFLPGGFGVLWVYYYIAQDYYRETDVSVALLA